MRKKSIWFILFIILATGFVILWVNSNITQESKPDEEFLPLPLLNLQMYDLKNLIADMNNETLHDGNFNTQGVVIGIFPCQSCPVGAKCIPCKGDFLIVAENPEVEQPTNKKILIDVGSQKMLDAFRIGSAYIFSVSIESAAESINLMGYQLVPKERF